MYEIEQREGEEGAREDEAVCTAGGLFVQQEAGFAERGGAALAQVIGND